MIPVLMITHNRCKFTVHALLSLVKTDCGKIYVFDNASDQGTKDFLGGFEHHHQSPRYQVHFSETNIGIAGAMNWFLNEVKGCQYAVKCDNDTILPENFCELMLPHMQHADIVQAKHHILKETHEGGFDEWVKNMPAKGALRYNHFVGGSGIMFKPDQVTTLNATDSLIMGWRQWQREHPELKKAFATDVEIDLLDTDSNGAKYPDSYTDYYRKNGRII